MKLTVPATILASAIFAALTAVSAANATTPKMIGISSGMEIHPLNADGSGITLGENINLNEKYSINITDPSQPFAAMTFELTAGADKIVSVFAINISKIFDKNTLPKDAKKIEIIDGDIVRSVFVFSVGAISLEDLQEQVVAVLGHIGRGNGDAALIHHFSQQRTQLGMVSEDANAQHNLMKPTTMATSEVLAAANQDYAAQAA